MGFLERLNGVLQNNNKSVSKNGSTSPYFGLGFNSNALKKYNLTQDTIAINTSKYATEADISSDYLAINQPVRFIRKYFNQETIQNAIAKNPNIERILKENGLECNFNFDNVESIMMSHLIPTAKTAQKLYCKMGHKPEEIDYLHLTQAALLHDIGKGFIPSEILNKRGKLTLKERSIIQLHNLH